MYTAAIIVMIQTSQAFHCLSRLVQQLGAMFISMKTRYGLRSSIRNFLCITLPTLQMCYSRNISVKNLLRSLDCCALYLENYLADRCQMFATSEVGFSDCPCRKNGEYMICGMCLLFLCCVTYHPHLVVNKEGSCSQTNIYTLISAPTENLVQWNPSNPDTMGPPKVS